MLSACMPSVRARRLASLCCAHVGPDPPAFWMPETLVQRSSNSSVTGARRTPTSADQPHRARRYSTSVRSLLLTIEASRDFRFQTPHFLPTRAHTNFRQRPLACAPEQIQPATPLTAAIALRVQINEYVAPKEPALARLLRNNMRL